jgi:hypothetical protein
VGEQFWMDMAALQVIAGRLVASAGVLETESARLEERGLDRLALSVRAWSEATALNSRQLVATVHDYASQDMDNGHLIDGGLR